MKEGIRNALKLRDNYLHGLRALKLKIIDFARECVFICHMIFIINNNYYRKQHKPNGLCNRLIVLYLK